MRQNKPFDFKNKLVLVTGASSGIGYSVSKEFAKHNARLALLGRNREKLIDLKNELNKDGKDAEIFTFDLNQTENIPSLVKKIESKFNDTVDVLVNSAGVAVLGLIENVPLKSYSDNLKINFFAPLSLIKSVLPGMKQKKSGQIINLFSGVGKRGLPGVSSYCVSKFALNGLTESLRVEVSPYNIDVILFSPGLVQTRFANNCKIFRPLKETFTKGKAVTAEFAAEKIVEASVKRKRDVILSTKTRFGIHANYLFPSILDRILAKKL